MTREEIINRVGKIFKDIFDDSSLVISEHLSPDQIDSWDSLNHINLLTAVQQEFHIKFELSELHRLNDVKTMVDAIVNKVS